MLVQEADGACAEEQTQYCISITKLLLVAVLGLSLFKFASCLNVQTVSRLTVTLKTECVGYPVNNSICGDLVCGL